MSKTHDTDIASRRRRSGRVPVGGARVIGDAISDEIAGLASLDLSALRSRWDEVVGRPAPRGFQREFLLRALAQEVQVRAFGGLSPAMKRRLRELVEAAREDRFDEALGAPSLKPGTLLVRVWQGQTHRVMVARDGFVWNGDRHGSLSTIAKAITGTSWNGWTFFGVKRPTGRNKNASRSNREASLSLTAGDADRDGAEPFETPATECNQQSATTGSIPIACADAEAGALTETTSAAQFTRIGTESADA